MANFRSESIEEIVEGSNAGDKYDVQVKIWKDNHFYNQDAYLVVDETMYGDKSYNLYDKNGEAIPEYYMYNPINDDTGSIDDFIKVYDTPSTMSSNGDNLAAPSVDDYSSEPAVPLSNGETEPQSPTNWRKEGFDVEASGVNFGTDKMFEPATAGDGFSADLSRTLDALDYVNDKISSFESTYSKLGNVDFSNVPSLSTIASDLKTKTSCLNGSLGIKGSSGVLNNVFNNVYDTLNDLFRMQTKDRFGDTNIDFAQAHLNEMAAIANWRDNGFPESPDGIAEWYADTTYYQYLWDMIDGAGEYIDNGNGTYTFKRSDHTLYFVDGAIESYIDDFGNVTYVKDGAPYQTILANYGRIMVDFTDRNNPSFYYENREGNVSKYTQMFEGVDFSSGKWYEHNGSFYYIVAGDEERKLDSMNTTAVGCPWAGQDPSTLDYYDCYMIVNGKPIKVDLYNDDSDHFNLNSNYCLDEYIDELNKIPGKVLQNLYTTDQKVVLIPSYEYIIEGKDQEANAFFWNNYSDGKGRVYLKNPHSVIHEFGHSFDYSLGDNPELLTTPLGENIIAMNKFIGFRI